MPQLANSRLVTQLQRRTKTLAYVDAGYYLPPADTSTLDAYGQPTASTVSVAVMCAFSDKPAAETWKEYDLAEFDAEVRFVAPTPNKGGRFKLTTRFGAAVTEQTYEIVGIQNRGAFGYVCALKAVAI